MRPENTVNDPFVSDLFDQYDHLVARARSYFSFRRLSMSAQCVLRRQENTQFDTEVTVNYSYCNRKTLENT